MEIQFLIFKASIRTLLKTVLFSTSILVLIHFTLLVLLQYYHSKEWNSWLTFCHDLLLLQIFSAQLVYKLHTIEHTIEQMVATLQIHITCSLVAENNPTVCLYQIPSWCIMGIRGLQILS